MLALEPYLSPSPVASPRKGLKVLPFLSVAGLISKFQASFATQGTMDRRGGCTQREETEIRIAKDIV